MSDIVTAIDVSSHQSPQDLVNAIATYQPSHVICRLYLPGESPSQDVSREHVRIVRDHGLTPGGYHWGYRSFDPVDSLLRALDLCSSMDLVLPIVHLDAETYTNQAGVVIDPGPDATWLSRYYEAADSLLTPAGIYTGEWWVDGHFPGGKAAYEPFIGRPHWLSAYDGVQTLDPWSLWAGRVNLIGKQYAGSPIDQSVLLREYTEVGSTPPVDPCAELQAKHDQVLAGLDTIIDKRPYKAPAKRDLVAVRQGG